MIDINKAQTFYKQYISSYNPEDPKIALKIAHIFRTAEKAKNIALHLQLSEEDRKLAELIGMLHDIGRFEQIKQYHTFNDKKSINHGEYGVEILKKGLIKEFIEDRQYDDIIYRAIINHNRDNIEEGLDEKTLLHCKIIRDADKWDIFYVLVTEKEEALWGISHPVFDEEITPAVFEKYMETGRMDYAHRSRKEDSFISYLAFVFDINFDYTFENIVKEDYLTIIRNRYQYQNLNLVEQLEKAYNKANQEINRRLNNK